MSVQKGPGNSFRTWRWLPAWIIFLLLCLAACSDTGSPDASKGAPQPISPQAPGPRLAENAARKNPQAGGLIEDRGAPCASHRYVVAPGTSTLLTFEVALSPQQSTEIAPDALQLRNSQWEEIGVSASLGYCRIESEDASQARWVVDGREFLRDSRQRDRAPVFTTAGDVVIVWAADGYGTLSQTRRLRRAEDLGQLSEAQIAEQLGGSTTIEYTDPETEKTYTWIAEQRALETTVQVLVIELTVDTPAAARDAAPKSLEVWSQSAHWAISAQYSDFRDVFIVTGPGERLSCLAGGGP